MPEAHVGPDEVDLIEVLAIALSLALVLGFVARLVRLPPIAGYLVAGAILSPNVLGNDSVGDTDTVHQVADLGVIFLMFGVGLRFHIRDLLSVRWIVVPGAFIQISLATLAGTGIGLLLGLPGRESVVLGIAISIPSTVVLVRILSDRGLLGSVHAQVAIGWLVVQDLATVVILAAMPAFEPGAEGNVAVEALISLGAAAVFLAVMLIAGTRVLPLILQYVGTHGTRELFVLAVVVAALGIASGATVFGVSLALGAFIAGITISEADTSAQAAADVLPLREAFAVLFFVSVGLLLDVEMLVDHLDLFALILLAVLTVNAIVAIGRVTFSSLPIRTGFIVAAGLSNVGEFSFIIINEALDLEILSESTHSTILAASVITIALSRFVFMFHEHLGRWAEDRWPFGTREAEAASFSTVTASDHVVVAGYGRVGQLLYHSLASAGTRAVVIESDLALVRRAVDAGVDAVWGDAGSDEVLHRAHLEEARLLVVAVPDESTTVLAISSARRMCPALPIIARANTRPDLDLYYQMGVQEVVVPEFEGGLELTERTLTALGFDSEDAASFMRAQRDIHYGAAGFTREIHGSGD